MKFLYFLKRPKYFPFPSLTAVWMRMASRIPSLFFTVHSLKYSFSLQATSSSQKHHSLLSLFSLSLFGLFASSTRTTSTKYLSKPNMFLSTIIDLCGSVQPDLDIPFQSLCIEQGIETNSGHNKEESIENRTQKKMSKGDLQRLHFMGHQWALWSGEKDYLKYNYEHFHNRSKTY